MQLLSTVTQSFLSDNLNVYSYSLVEEMVRLINNLQWELGKNPERPSLIWKNFVKLWENPATNPAFGIIANITYERHINQSIVHEHT